jgi:Tfp pilus assembly protein PilF
MRTFSVSFILTLQLLLLSACTTTQPPLKSNEIPWQDQTFSYNKETKIITQNELFKLDEELHATLTSPHISSMSDQDKLNYFLTYFYRLGTNVFPYQHNLSTVASETWRNKQGDCISLTLLSYAIGKTLKLDIKMQEVNVPIQVDRRGNVDYLSGHVNAVIFDNSKYNIEDGLVRKYLTIDFTQLPTSTRLGKRLNENQITARFYNNLGAKNFVDKNYTMAYHYYKAAIEHDPDYQATYVNLALIYRNSKLNDAAEQVLITALKLNPDNFIALNSLKEIYTTSGRIALSEKMEEMINKSNDKNPYYWMGLGLAEMQDKNYGLAIKHLEKASRLTQGFVELHQNLADAYFQMGDITKVKMQLKEIRSLNPNHPKLRFESNLN